MMRAGRSRRVLRNGVWRSNGRQAGNARVIFADERAYHHIVSLHRAEKPAIRRVVFEAADRDMVAALHAKVTASGVVHWNAARRECGWRRLRGLASRTGRRNLAVACGGVQNAAAPDRTSRRKVTHVISQRARLRCSTRFLTEVLDFG